MNRRPRYGQRRTPGNTVPIAKMKAAASRKDTGGPPTQERTAKNNAVPQANWRNCRREGCQLNAGKCIRNSILVERLSTSVSRT
jgi:hypothetical protein